MTAESTPLAPRPLAGTRLLAGVTLVVGAGLIVAWLVASTTGGGLPLWIAGLKFNVAVAFLLIGASLLGVTSRRPARLFGAGLALGAIAIGLATLAQYLFGLDLGIDNLIVRDPLPVTLATVPGRMSPLTALSVALLGGATLLLWLRRTGGAAWLAATAMTIGVLNLLEQAYGAQVPSFLAGTTDMAVITAAGIVVASLSVLLAAPTLGLVGLILRPDLAGTVARRVMVAAVVLAVGVGWLRLVGERAGLFDTAYGVSLAVVVNLLLFAAVVWWVGRTIIRLEVARTEAERAARERDRRFQTLASAAPVGIVLTDTGGACTYANDAWGAITGRTPDDALGTGWALPLHPEDAGRIGEAWAAALRDGHDFDEIYRFCRPDGSVRWVQGRIAPLSDNKTITGYVGIANDITEQREASHQLAALGNELQRSNRELQDFASAASHDLQEPLRKIQAFGDRLAGRHAEQLDETGRDYLERMVGAATRMQALITNLLAFSRVATRVHEPEPVALGHVVDEVLLDLEQRISETDGRIEVGPLPTIEADPVQMRQLFQNLVGNALKYRRPEEPPIVRVSAETVGQRVRISIADNGIGFEQSQADKVFAPFQRLHARSAYEGTGMGLAICRRIVERHAGMIGVTSQPGVGTTFVVDLPNQSGRLRRAA